MTVKDLLDACGEDFAANIIVLPPEDSEIPFEFYEVKFLGVFNGELKLQMGEVSE